MADEKPSPTVPPSALRSTQKFVAAHGKPARAVVENLGRAGARVVLVGADGAMGDVLVPDPATGAALVAHVEDVTAADWDAETTAAARIGAVHRNRMAGPHWRRWAKRPAALR